jgi:hypothetical protein
MRIDSGERTGVNKRPDDVRPFVFRTLGVRSEGFSSEGSRGETVMGSPKDFWSGVIYILFGSIALWIGRDYSMGTALRMGPAYFPSLLGGGLMFIGAIALFRAFILKSGPIGALAWRKVAFVVGSVVLFGCIIRGVGLLIAVPLLVITSALASSKFGWGSTLAMAAGLTVFCALVFLKGLGVPLPLIGSWIGG